MREIGEVVSQFNRFLICRSDRKANNYLGETVYSADGKVVGKVVDVFGPVKAPYLKILKKNGEDVKALYLKQKPRGTHHHPNKRYIKVA
ncbi:MAG: hypothetical protein HXS46_09920 [Theionarchaea archaeon]|nr:MAG: hypothetical protein AYK18_01115 [Theionarchaea archaeon DG-70]MBU7010996.1 hypothetical protein [Theionarchaea archaeon]